MNEFIVEYLNKDNTISEIRINANGIYRALQDAEIELKFGLNDDVKEIISISKVRYLLKN